MEKKAFKLLHDAESSWWYQGRRQTIERTLSLLPRRSSPRVILDVGAGFGGMYETLKVYGEVYAMEPDQDARILAKTRGYKKVFSSLEEIAQENLAFDLIGAFDVIEHTSNDTEFLHQLHGLLRPEGSIIATVPAYPWLWSAHDVLHHHYRRYAKKTFSELFKKNRFTVLYCAHWNMFLLPLAILARVMGKSGEGSMESGSLINTVFTMILRFESSLIPHLSLPWGVSLVLFVRKN